MTCLVFKNHFEIAAQGEECGMPGEFELNRSNRFLRVLPAYLRKARYSHNVEKVVNNL